MSVGLSVGRNREPCKTAQPIKMPFWNADQDMARGSNHVSDEIRIFFTGRDTFQGT